MVLSTRCMAHTGAHGTSFIITTGPGGISWEQDTGEHRELQQSGVVDCCNEQIHPNPPEKY